MTVLIAGIITFAVVSAWYMGVERGKTDRLMELLELRREVRELNDAMSNCVCGHDDVPLSDSEFRAWHRIVEGER